MSSSDRKEHEKQELRQKIFEAASHIILEQGYEQLSMCKIVEKIEYSPVVLYSYAGVIIGTNPRSLENTGFRRFNPKPCRL